MTIFDHFQQIFGIFFFNFEFSYSEFFSGRFDTSGSMIPRLVPEISPLDAFCDVVGVGVVGIGDSRSWIGGLTHLGSERERVTFFWQCLGWEDPKGMF